MFCTKCQNPVYDCECDDIEERLEELGDLDHFATTRCLNCQEPRRSCTCDEYEPADEATSQRMDDATTGGSS